MELLAIGAAPAAAAVIGKMEFEPIVSKDLKLLEQPTLIELWSLRTEIDPGGRTLSGFSTDFHVERGGWISPDASATGSLAL